MVGAASSTVSTPAASAASAHPSSSSSGRSGTIAPSMPARGERGGEALVAQRAGPGCSRSSRRAGRRRRAWRASVDDRRRRGADARGPAATPPGWCGRPSPGRRTGCRSRSRRRRRRRPRARRRASPTPSPPVTYGHEQLAARVAPGPQVRLERSRRARSPVRRSATCAASLSPRPDSVTSTVEPVGTDAPGLAREPADRVRRLERGHDALGHRRAAGSRRAPRRRSRSAYVGPAGGGELRRARARRPGSRARR